MPKLTVITVLMMMCAPITQARSEAVNLLQFQTSDPAVWNQLKQRSDSLPLRQQDLKKLTAAGLSEATVIEMMRTRGVLILADGDTLSTLKKNGASDAYVAAISAHAVAPNQSFTLRIQLDLLNIIRTSDAQFLYIEAWHRGTKRPIGFFQADLQRLVHTQGVVAATRRTNDPLLPETIRSIRFVTRVKARQFGEIDLRILVSPIGGLTTLGHADGTPVEGVKVQRLEYPPVSLDNRCDLNLAARQDELLPERITLTTAKLNCRWE
ncbi:MAG: hypothetical protein VX589_00440 [Myxococcota bacterium]|nr:hypothetical protein [Myxococcota bacterium]